MDKGRKLQTQNKSFSFRIFLKQIKNNMAEVS